MSKGFHSVNANQDEAGANLVHCILSYTEYSKLNKQKRQEIKKKGYGPRVCGDNLIIINE